MTIAKLTITSIKKHIKLSSFTKDNKLDKRNEIEELKFFAANARTLADFMEAHTINHQQHTYGEGNPVHPCKTAACALGTAAVYNLLPGLQYTYHDCDFQNLIEAIEVDNKEAIKYFDAPIVPIINGKDNDDWYSAGCKFFGDSIADNIFSDVSLTKAQVVAGLRAYATKYDATAATLEAENTIEKFRKALRNY